MLENQKKILVIGAGPKAIALAIKTKVLKQVEIKTPDIYIFEQNEVAANWSGNYGYTNGDMPLGTSPEKDLGFPYNTELFSDEINHKINHAMQAYSWASFLIENKTYSDWVDRDKPAPLHKQWAEYLQWALNKLKNSVNLKIAQVTQIKLKQQQWQVHTKNKQSRIENFIFDSIILTGPGEQNYPIPVPVHENILNTQSFWLNTQKFNLLKNKRIGIIGSGENAASIALALSKNTGLSIDIISRHNALYTRGESYFENRVYSDANKTHWHQLSIEQKKEFIKRTDIGVFSQKSLEILNSLHQINLVMAVVSCVKLTNQQFLLKSKQHHPDNFDQAYDYIIFATGSSPVTMLTKLLGAEQTQKIIKLNSLQQDINSHLAVNYLPAPLHFPMLAGIAQGPGYANLSCLGKLSDSILSRYVQCTQYSCINTLAHAS